jgi:hypothetical protein
MRRSSQGVVLLLAFVLSGGKLLWTAYRTVTGARVGHPWPFQDPAETERGDGSDRRLRVQGPLHAKTDGEGMLWEID